MLGFSFWGGKYALNPATDYLSEGAALAKEVGAGSIGVWMGGGLDPSTVYPFHSPQWPDELPPASLTELAQLPYYKAVLDDPAIKIYVINAYAVATAGIGLKLRFGTYSDADAANERMEFGNLCVLLVMGLTGFLSFLGAMHAKSCTVAGPFLLSLSHFHFLPPQTPPPPP